MAALVKNEVTVDPNLVVYESIIFGNKAVTKRRMRLEYATEKQKIQWASDINPTTFIWSDDDFMAVQNVWPKFVEFVRLLHDNGIILTAGSDLINPWITPGVAFHRELELLVDSGIPSSEVIKIATRNGAIVLGILDKAGTIEEGRTANLVIFNADPIMNISNTKEIYSIMFEGKLFSKVELDNMLKAKVNN